MIMYPLSQLFRLGVVSKNFLYDQKVSKVKSLPSRVVSVGNITVGGTGKTSFTIWLMRELTARKVACGVISRGYGGKVTGVSKVPVHGDPSIYGDEPCLMAAEELGPVYVGPDRYSAGMALLKEQSVPIVIADDAFQHRKLFRDIDVVLLDLSEPKTQWSFLPNGKLREDFKSLARADILVKTKRKFAEAQNAVFVESHLPKDKLTLEMDYDFHRILSVKNVEVEWDKSSYMLVSGVAQPKGVEILAREKIVISDHMIFDDHHAYTTEDVRQILTQLDHVGSARVLTTAKDAVKLRFFPDLKDKLYVMDLSFDVKGQVDEFFKQVIP